MSMLCRLAGRLAGSLLCLAPALALDLESTTVPNRIVPSLGNGEIAINRADKRLIFKTIDGAVGYGSLLDAAPAGRKAVENGDASNLTLGSAGRTLQARAQDTFNAKDLGALGVAGDDTAALTSYIGSVGEGAAMRFTTGIYPSSTALHSTGKGLQVLGQGSRLTRLRKIGNGDGWSVTLNGGRQSADLRGVTLETTGYNAGTAYTVNYTPLGFENRESTRVLWDDVEIRGTDIKTSGWSRLAHFTNVNGATFSKLQLNGISTGGTGSGDQASQTITAIGLEWDGNEYPTDALFSHNRAYQLGTAYKFRGATEGINFDQFTAVSVGTMVDWAATPAGRPHFSLANGHANAFEHIAKLDGVQQVGIYNVQGYHQQGSSSNGVLYKINNGIDGEFVGNGLFKYSTPYNATANPPTGVTTTGIALSGDATRSFNISRNHFGGAYTTLDTCVTIAANTPGVVIANDNYWNCKVDVVDQTGGKVQYGARRDVFQIAGASASIPNATVKTIPFDSVKDESFLGLVRNADGSFKVPPGKGIFRIAATVMAAFDGVVGGSLQVRIRKNDETVPYAIENRPGTGNDAFTLHSLVIPVAANDTILIEAYQTSGQARMISGSGYTQVVFQAQ